MKHFTPSNSKEIVDRGEEIYADNYKAAYEKAHMGKFVAIDVDTGAAYLGDTALQAIDNGVASAPRAFFTWSESAPWPRSG